MSKTKLRKEYDKQFEFMKESNHSEWLYRTSNTMYILWLEAKLNNLPPPKVWVLFWKDIFNIVDPLQMKIYKTLGGAERARDRLMKNHPQYEGMWEIREEEVRP